MKLDLLTNASIVEDALKFVLANKDKVKFKYNNKPLKFDDITSEKMIESVF